MEQIQVSYISRKVGIGFSFRMRRVAFRIVESHGKQDIVVMGRFACRPVGYVAVVKKPGLYVGVAVGKNHCEVQQGEKCCCPCDQSFLF